MGKPIAFLTDLGCIDDAVGMCKGLMLQRSPSSQIIDITHEVPPFNITEGGLYLADLPSFFPSETVFAAVVIPETGAIPCVAARNEQGQIFVAADNGVLTWVNRSTPLTQIRRIDNPECMVYPPSPTFWGRDLVVACAGSLAGGFPFEEVGEELPTIQVLDYAEPEMSADNGIIGTVSIIDKNFGNVWTNISSDVCSGAGIEFGSDVTVVFDSSEPLTMPYVQTFAHVPFGAPLAYVNSRGRLAFARNQGSLQELISVPSGAEVRIASVNAVTGATPVAAVS